MFTTLASAYRWADHLTQSLPDNEVRESHNVTQCNTLKTALRAKGGTAGWTQSRSPRVSCALSHGGQGSGMGVGHAVSPASRRSEFKLKCGFYSTHITSAPPQSRKITAQTIVKSGTLYIHMSNHYAARLKFITSAEEAEQASLSRHLSPQAESGATPRLLACLIFGCALIL